MNNRLNEFLRKFRRVTSSGEFLAEIDGLRFVAITTVFLFHVQSVMFLNPRFGSVVHNEHFWVLDGIYTNGWQGVELFFVISGFILGLPFAREKILGAKKVNLKSYFIRRVTRLEPPYFVAMVFFFFVHIVSGTYTLGELFPSLASTLTYTHNILFGNEKYITSVAWSLEIEVQFYLLAPWLSAVFFLQKISRRVTLVSLIMVFSVLQTLLPSNISTLYSYLQFFLTGFLIANIFITEKDLRLSPALTLVGTSVFLCFILYIDHTLSIFSHLGFIASIFCLVYLALTQTAVKKIFSNIWLSTIGGMCYSIYLVHTPILNIVRKQSHWLRVGESLEFNLVVLTAVSILIVLLLSAIFFRVVEKPCMDKDWYKKLWNRTVSTRSVPGGE